MLKRVFYLLVIVGLIGGMASCRGKKSMVKEDKGVSKNVGLIKGVVDKELDFESIEIKYSTRAEMDGKNYSLNITYRNKKNEMLWVSVRAMLGIEAARIIADRDSVWVISKIGQVKEKGSWNEMSNVLGYPLDFMAFQNIMSRKLFYPGSEEVKVLETFVKREEGKNLVLLPDFKNAAHKKDIGVFGFLPRFVIDKGSESLISTKLASEDNGWMLKVVYDEEARENMGLGASMKITAIDSESNLDLDLKIQQVSINESLKFPFQWF